MEAKIRAKIRSWYFENKRALPWREKTDPYSIWVSEIILQQTRVDQGLDYYHRFLERFPDVESLANAGEDEVLKVWEGLGYYTRARNMHASARQVSLEAGGSFPVDYRGLLKLKGVGPYTASAVASIASGEPRAVLDGNVHRVLSRLYGISEPTASYSASSHTLAAAERLLDTEDPGTHNQALMELGALICKPGRPDCISCPLHKYCYAFREDRVEEFPPARKAPEKRYRHFHYLLILDGDGIWIRQRRGKDIWNGLYEFPLVETAEPAEMEWLVNHKEWSLLSWNGLVPELVQGPVKHVLSHQVILARFYLVRKAGAIESAEHFRIKTHEFQSFPKPKLISNFLERFID